jgi:hypothetical protein
MPCFFASSRIFCTIVSIAIRIATSYGLCVRLVAAYLAIDGRR